MDPPDPFGRFEQDAHTAPLRVRPVGDRLVAVAVDM
jgi:hypothetical protein